MDHIITLNAGSSSLKFGLFAASQSDPVLICSGIVENIGSSSAHIRLRERDGKSLEDGVSDALRDHGAALDSILNLLQIEFPHARIAAVGHRVVHGGPNNGGPVVLTPDSLEKLRQLEPFAPLHQPVNLDGAQDAMKRFPEAKQVACFDTAFHRNHPWVNDTFALPSEFYDIGVRRYGFHGLSYEYVSGHLKETAPLIHGGRVVVAHLGNGASMCAMIDGRSVGSSMGFSAMDGLPMGTRCGQLDPGVVLYLMDQCSMSADEISDLLYRKSGLLGLSGMTSDMRTLEASDAPGARNAINYFTFRIRRELGAMAAVLGGLDALVFTGGIGENSTYIRERICTDMGWLGIELDHDANADNRTVISTDLSRVTLMVVPTNEELVIARAALQLMKV